MDLVSSMSRRAIASISPVKPFAMDGHPPCSVRAGPEFAGMAEARTACACAFVASTWDSTRVLHPRSTCTEAATDAEGR